MNKTDYEKNWEEKSFDIYSLEVVSEEGLLDTFGTNFLSKIHSVRNPFERHFWISPHLTTMSPKKNGISMFRKHVLSFRTLRKHFYPTLSFKKSNQSVKVSRCEPDKHLNVGSLSNFCQFNSRQCSRLYRCQPSPLMELCLRVEVTSWYQGLWLHCQPGRCKRIFMFSITARGCC